MKECKYWLVEGAIDAERTMGWAEFGSTENEHEPCGECEACLESEAHEDDGPPGNGPDETAHYRSEG